MTRRTFLTGAVASGLSSAAPAALPQFLDITARAGLNFLHQSSATPEKYLIEAMGSGVALFDFDNDGRLDLFFVNGAALNSPMRPGGQADKSDPKFWNRLYHNNGDGTFTDVTKDAGLMGHSYGMGVAAGDYDNDGFTDLYVTNFGRNILYHNNGDGTFTDVTRNAGVECGGWSSSACWVDYDRDGRLDLIVTQYLRWDYPLNLYCGEKKPGYRSYCHPDHFKPAMHIVYHNNGDGTFTDVTEKCGFAKSPGKGLGIAINDFDKDGWPDILVANDSFPQQLFRNKRNGTFEEIGLPSGIAYDDDGKTFAGMGVDFGDFDNDGWPDIFINALSNQRYALFRGNAGLFEYVSGAAGVGAITALSAGWGTKFLDYDNDGWRDIFVGQGHVMDNIELTQPSIRYLQKPLLMRNVRGKFEDVSSRSGASFQLLRAARGVACGDWNNDGLIDIAVNCNNGPGLLLQNQGGSGNHWLMIDTVGTKSNRDGIGARLTLTAESGAKQYAIVSTAGSYQSSSDKRVHFGLGSERRARRLEIHWPSGIVQQLDNIDADQVLKVKEAAR
ncbi:MAG TPA: CRTAC1 family protein [Bryobacteraceae bacterium]|nr:CRTAC1 family protein [Bryobacteraceae bacterium]